MVNLVPSQNYNAVRSQAGFCGLWSPGFTKSASSPRPSPVAGVGLLLKDCDDKSYLGKTGNCPNLTAQRQPWRHFGIFFLFPSVA